MVPGAHKRLDLHDALPFWCFVDAQDAAALVYNALTLNVLLGVWVNPEVFYMIRPETAQFYREVTLA